MHRQRIITGLSLLPFLIFLVAMGGVWITTLVAVVSLITLWEFYRLCFHAHPAWPRHPLVIVAFVLTPVIAVAAGYGRPLHLLLLMALDLILCGLISLVRYSREKEALPVLAMQATGLLYVPVMLGFILQMRNSPDGVWWVLMTLCLVFGNDTAAYFTGHRFGRHKLWPSISPGKTIEGAVGGLAASIIVGCLFKLAFLPEMPLDAGLVMFTVAGVIGPLGDLFESVLKRNSGIKDSGGILPGHGGFLDRIDALLFVSPIIYLFKTTMF